VKQNQVNLTLETSLMNNTLSNLNKSKISAKLDKKPFLSLTRSNFSHQDLSLITDARISEEAAKLEKLKRRAEVSNEI